MINYKDQIALDTLRQEIRLLVKLAATELNLQRLAHYNNLIETYEARIERINAQHDQQ